MVSGRGPTPLTAVEYFNRANSLRVMTVKPLIHLCFCRGLFILITLPTYSYLRVLWEMSDSDDDYDADHLPPLGLPRQLFSICCFITKKWGSHLTTYAISERVRVQQLL